MKKRVDNLNFSLMKKQRILTGVCELITYIRTSFPYYYYWIYPIIDFGRGKKKTKFVKSKIYIYIQLFYYLPSLLINPRLLYPYSICTKKEYYSGLKLHIMFLLI